MLNSNVSPRECPPNKLLSSDENLEAKLFPHLFPDGKGSWSKQNFAYTLGQYHKHRLLQIDRRLANDKLYLCFAFDRNMKYRILSYPHIPNLSNANKKKNVTVAEISKNQSGYNNFSKALTASVTGSKSLWKKKWLDLVVLVGHPGAADLFVTLTANDKWHGLKKILSKYKQPQSILHPVDTT